MAETIELQDWLDYLNSRVGVDLYVWGANGEPLIELLNKIYDMERTKSDVDRVLTLLQKRLINGVDIYKICCEDCSGLAVNYLLKFKIITSDMTANSLYLYSKKNGKEISVSEATAGDYLFEGISSNKWHVGYAIGKGYAIECQNHDVGVVITKISERKWSYATRPNWYTGSQPGPEPEVVVLTRELKLEDPMMRGDDVKAVQERLNLLGYDCGKADGVFGSKTDRAVRTFQNDKGLSVDGIVGKNTAKKLGFKWNG